MSARIGEDVGPLFTQELPNSDTGTLVAAAVTYAPGEKSKPHHHAATAFIYAYVLSGRIRSHIDDQPAKVYRAGESFYEALGSQRMRSENASDTQPAKLLAVFVVNPRAHASLTTPHEE